MLLRLDTFLATTTAILMATSNIVDVTAAVPNCGIGPGVTRGLSIYPETIFGEAALGSLNGKEFSFHYVENVSDEWSESHGARSDKARLKFYKDCVKHQAANDVEREGRKVLECPVATCMHFNRTCHAVPFYSEANSEIIPIMAAINGPDVKGLRNSVVNQLIAAHQTAFKLGWYLSWNPQDIALRGGKQLVISTYEFLMDVNFKYLMAGEQGWISNPREKVAHYKESMRKFLNLFFAKYTVPGENKDRLIVDVIRQLPGVLGPRIVDNNNNMAAAAA